MNFFITGGAGFIGTNLTKFLINLGHEVTIFDNLSNSNPEYTMLIQQGANFILGDVLDTGLLIDSLYNNECVIHLAANSDILLSSKSPQIDFDQTIVGTFSLLQAMKACKINKLIFSSGSGVYGDHPQTSTPEDYGPLMPISMYGASKLSAEAMISAFSHLFEINAVIFRFANVVGPGQTHGVAYDFINRLVADPTQLTVMGNGTQEKSYIHISDVIKALSLAFNIVNNQKLEIFNLSTGNSITVAEIARIVIAEMKLQNVSLNFGTTAFGWAGDVPCVYLDDKKFRRLGWKNDLSSTEAITESVRSMINAMQNKG